VTDTVDALEGFTKDTFSHEGRSCAVYRIGSGPAVVVIPEAPGPTPEVLGFARRVGEAGYTAVVPELFGVAGKPESLLYVAQTITRACVSKEFATLAKGRTSPITNWVRALGRHEHERCGGPGIGVVGMCLTGGFALAMLADEAVLAPVLSQPSLPFGVTAAHRADLGVGDDDWARGKQRVLDDDICVLGLRFTGDKLSPPSRFRTLREELGDNFVGVEIDSSKGNPHGIGTAAHSVLTRELVDEPGHPTADALAQVFELFRTRLKPATTTPPDSGDI
jgi:dienelactone hydrolase